MEDHKRNAMLNTELARPIGIVAGISIGGTRKPRTHQRFSPVLITYTDGSQSVITKQTRTHDGKRTTKTVKTPIPHRTTAADLPAIFAD